jgi:hypothetical protein
MKRPYSAAQNPRDKSQGKVPVPMVDAVEEILDAPDSRLIVCRVPDGLGGSFEIAFVKSLPKARQVKFIQQALNHAKHVRGL